MFALHKLVLVVQALLAVLMLGGASGGCAIFLRALPWPKAWKARKPLACPACMGGWSSFCAGGLAWDAGFFAGWGAGLLALGWFFATGIAAVMFSYVNPPMIELPEEAPVLPAEEASE